MAVTGTSTTRLGELKKYTVTTDFTKKYITGGNAYNDGIVLPDSSPSTQIVYFIGGIKYIDMLSGANSGITYTIYTPEGITAKNFIFETEYKNPNKDNIISNPKIEDDVFIERQELSAFDKNYRLEYIKTLKDLLTYAGGSFFKIVNNS